MAACRATFLVVVAVALICVVGCREGDIQISGLTFNGVKQVDKGALANALQTKKGSWIPWGRKRYFDRRANSARDYLVMRGIATSRLRTVSYGEDRPIDTNETAAGRARNRRAHLAVIMQ